MIFQEGATIESASFHILFLCFDQLRAMREDAVFVPRNLTSDTVPNPAKNTTTLLQFVSLGLIIALGSAGNALVLYAIGRYLQPKKSPYSLMAGFVALDLTRVLLCFPVTFITVVHRLQLRYGSELCQMIGFTNVFCLLGNNLGVFGMALDRYVNNKHRATYKRKFRNSFGTVMFFVTSCMAFLCTFPTIYGVRRNPDGIVGPQCTYPHFYYPNNVDTLGLMISFITVTLLTNGLYVKLFFFLRSRRKMRPVLYEPAVSQNWGFYDHRVARSVRQTWDAEFIPEPAISIIDRNSLHHHLPPTNYEIALWRSQKRRDDEKLTKLCFYVNGIFNVMWLPYVIVCFWYAVEFDNQNTQVPEWLEISATWLSYLQVIVTPVAFLNLSSFTRKTRQVHEKQRFSPALSISSN